MMFAALYALLLGGIAAFLGGSSGGSTAPAPAAPVSFTPPQLPDDDTDGDTTPTSTDPAPPPPTPSDPGGGTSGPPPSAYALDWSGLSQEEQLIVELINRARLSPDSEVARLNDDFASGVTSAPKEALAVVSTLSTASRDHSADMDDRDYFSHTNPDGESPSDRALAAGHGSRYVGENIGWVGSSRTSFDTQARAEGHHSNLWSSDGHQRNLMGENWSEIGVGYDYGDYNGYAGSTFVTEMFGDRGDTYLTGVVIEDGDSDRFYDLGEGQSAVRITAEAADGTLYTTSTWAAGGYTLKLPPGMYRVTFEGGELDSPFTTTVTIADQNVKLDVIDPGTSSGTAVSAALVAVPVLAEADGAENVLPQALPVTDETSMIEDETETVLEFF